MVMPEYNPTTEEQEWYSYCVRRNIRVSPGGLKGNPTKWVLEVSLDGESWNKSPKTYDKDDVWESYYQICKFYYEKRRN